MAQAQDILQQMPNMQVDGATTTVSYAYAISGKVMGIVVMVMMIIAALIMLAETNVFLDMAENVRRIAAKAHPPRDGRRNVDTHHRREPAARRLFCASKATRRLP